MQFRAIEVFCTLAILCLASGSGAAKELEAAHSYDSQVVLHDFHFASGETLPELRMHFTAYGTPHKDLRGHITNAVLILHGTGGSGNNFTNERFAGVLFQKGQLLDAAKYFIILPDGIGHGNSSKPSDALHARFPKYNYQDMVTAQYLLITKGLEIDHLRLVMGTSMGCMHTFLWGENYPDFMDALMPLACLPVQIAGRNRLWRDLVMDAIVNDPQYLKGEYVTEPASALRTAAGLLLIAGSAPIQMQLSLPSRDAADEFLQKYMPRQLADLDANDLLYAGERLSRLRSFRCTRQDQSTAAAGQFGRRFHQSTGTWNCGKANQVGEEWPLCSLAGLRADARPWHAYLGRGVAAVSCAVAGGFEEPRQ